MKRWSLAIGLLCLATTTSLSAQDTTGVYPWRLSYFPYLTASPNDGVMLLARGVLFRQSRWDDRVSLHDEVSLDGGYSTLNSWVARVDGEMPRIASGWRLQATGMIGHEARYVDDPDGTVAAADRQSIAGDLSRSLGGPAWFALRGNATGVQLSAEHERHFQGRAALVIDLRDREYDTRRGGLLQGGVIVGSSTDLLLHANGDGSNYTSPAHNYTGWYAEARGWAPVREGTRLTARAAIRVLSDQARSSIEATRSLPGWEDSYAVVGGPQSNRALPVAALQGTEVELLSAEVRQDLKTFPGGAVGILAFVDAGRASDRGDDVTVALRAGATNAYVAGDWTVGAGGGISIRLLRNAIMTATVGRAQHATRFYLSSGWSW